jgi:hypothetical protein
MMQHHINILYTELQTGNIGDFGIEEYAWYQYRARQD